MPSRTRSSSKHLAVERALLERLAAVERDRAVGTERLARRVVGERRPAVPDEAVLAPPVHDHAGRVEQVEPVGLLGPRRAHELRRDRADVGLGEPRPAPRRGSPA